jgi:hypothetical protein
MHPPHLRERALELIAAGHNDCQVALIMGIPRGTVRDWRRPSYFPRPRELCPRCWRHAKPIRFTPSDYSELLGLYLGDGYVSEGPRTALLRITLDAKYPGIIETTRTLLQRCFPNNAVGKITRPSGDLGGPCTVVSVSSVHLPCLFPQHGPGLKHQRRITLEAWQWQQLEDAPFAFLRGCIRSDGCAFINRTGPYSYLSYQFDNRSKDIVALFTRACHLAGLEYRVNCYRSKWRVRLNRRASVARLLDQVGLKY